MFVQVYTSPDSVVAIERRTNSAMNICAKVTPLLLLQLMLLSVTQIFASNEGNLMEKLLARIEFLEKEVSILAKGAAKEKQIDKNQEKKIDNLKDQTSDLLGQLTTFFVTHSSNSSTEGQSDVAGSFSAKQTSVFIDTIRSNIQDKY